VVATVMSRTVSRRRKDCPEVSNAEIMTVI